MSTGIDWRHPALLLSAVLAAGALAVMWRTAWAASARWFALAILGFGASLHLIDAPPAVAYQHYRLAPVGLADGIAWGILTGQGVVLLWLGRRHIRDVVAWIRASVHPAGLVVAVALLITTSAAPSRDPVQYLAEAAVASLTVGLALFTLGIAAREMPVREAAAAGGLADRLLGPRGVPGPQRPDGWSMRVAAAAVALSALLVVLVYERHPHVPDEVVYLLHARYLSEGMLAMPLPPVPAAFDLDLMQYEPGRWYSPVPPGWPLALAAGAWLGVPWLVNPVLGGLSVLLAYVLLGTLYDRRTTRLATLLLAGSPWFLFMSMSLMGHAATLACALAAAVGVAVARRTGASLPALLGGLGIGAVSLIRPLEGLAVAFLLGVWSLGARGRAFRFAPSAAVVAGTVLAAGLVLPYNAALTGSARVFPIMAYIDKYHAPGANDLGFGANRGLGWSGLDPFPGHGVADVGVNAVLNAFAINVEFLGWPVGVAVVLALAFSLRGRRWISGDRWLLAAIAVIAGIHSFYWFSGGPDFGARYWYLVIVPCAGLAARGIQRWDEHAIGTAEGSSAPRRQDARAVVMALCLAGLALALFVPWRSLGKYYHYRGMRADVRALAGEHGFGRSLVLVRGRRFPDYAAAAAYNPVDLRAGAPVYAWDVTPAVRRQVVSAYRDRAVWIIDGPSRTGAGFRVVAGPLSADAVLTDPTLPPAGADETLARDPLIPRRAGPAR